MHSGTKNLKIFEYKIVKLSVKVTRSYGFNCSPRVSPFCWNIIRDNRILNLSRNIKIKCY